VTGVVLPAIRHTGSFSLSRTDQASFSLPMSDDPTRRYIVIAAPGRPIHVRKTRPDAILDEKTAIDCEILCHNLKTIELWWQKVEQIRSIGLDPNGGFTVRTRCPSNMCSRTTLPSLAAMLREPLTVAGYSLPFLYGSSLCPLSRRTLSPPCSVSIAGRLVLLTVHTVTHHSENGQQVRAGTKELGWTGSRPRAAHGPVIPRKPDPKAPRVHWCIWTTAPIRCRRVAEA
jgi:hypothetical protein